MEKYKESKKNYNSDKTFVQISKDLHKRIKDYCLNKNIKVKDFLENILEKGLLK
jgi:hypothetical protein